MVWFTISFRKAMIKSSDLLLLLMKSNIGTMHARQLAKILF